MQRLDYLLECLKTKNLAELKLIERALEATYRWKKDPKKFAEPVIRENELKFKFSKTTEMEKNG